MLRTLQQVVVRSKKRLVREVRRRKQQDRGRRCYEHEEGCKQICPLVGLRIRLAFRLERAGNHPGTCPSCWH